MLEVVYPKPGHETFENSTFVIGRTQPGQQVVIAGDPVAVSPRGFFTHLVQLGPGTNDIRVEAFSSNDCSEPPADMLVCRILSHPPIPVPPETPLTVVTETVQPNADITLCTGDSFNVACLASPNTTVEVTIPSIPSVILLSQNEPGWVDNREAIFQELHQTKSRIPLTGYYQGTVTIPADAAEAENLTATLTLQHGGKETTVPFPGKLHLWTEPKPVKLTGTSSIVTRTGPSENADRLTPQHPGTISWADRIENNWARLRLGGDRIVWVPAETLTFLSEPQPLQKLTSVDIIQTNGGMTVQFNGAAACPIAIEKEPHRLQVTLFHTESDCEEIQYLKHDAVGFAIACPHLCGYDTGFDENGLWLTLKHLPDKWEDTVIFIDPGHGGETGTVGPNGLAEKDLNLSVAGQLAATLKNRGFRHVHLSRITDIDVSLQERADAAIKIEANLVLSIHHNALPDGRNPRNHEGLCCFYYHPFAQPLAAHLQNSLPKALDVPNYGLFYESFYMTRIHQAMAVLVEIGFFTCPTEFERLINPAFQQRFADTVATSLQTFLKRY